MRVPLRHRSTREHADDARDLRDGPVSRALAVNGEDRDGDDADDARDEGPVSPERAPHGTDSGTLGAAPASEAGALGAAEGASTTRGASHATVIRWGPTWTATETPTSGSP
jgi:hypothetical protein